MNVTLAIVIITVLTSISCFNNKQLFAKLMFNPYAVSHRKEYYRILTHALIHGDWMHLGVNILVLWSFGRAIERYFIADFGNKGMLIYLLLYVGGVVFSSLSALIRHKNNHNYNSVGASGAIGAVLFACILYSPMSMIYSFFIPVGIPAIIFGVLYMAYEIYMDKKSMDNIAHDAHYFGSAFGFVFPLFFKPELIFSFFQQIF